MAVVKYFRGNSFWENKVEAFLNGSFALWGRGEEVGELEGEKEIDEENGDSSKT